jgi:hypothetical protein
MSPVTNIQPDSVAALRALRDCLFAPLAFSGLFLGSILIGISFSLN